MSEERLEKLERTVEALGKYLVESLLEIRRAAEAGVANHASVVFLLEEKGVFSLEEYCDSKIRMVGMLDQVIAKAERSGE